MFIGGVGFQMAISGVENFFFEIGCLKRVARSGWWLAGIKQPESVAEHSFRTAVMAYALGELEGLSQAECDRAAMMALLHDLPEARCTDLHKVAQSYSRGCDSALEKAAVEQAKRMPEKMGGRFLQLYAELEARESKVAIIVKDADLVEAAFQAKEYLDAGAIGVREWIAHARDAVKTKSAKRLLSGLEKKNSNSWYEGLKKLR